MGRQEDLKWMLVDKYTVRFTKTYISFSSGTKIGKQLPISMDLTMGLHLLLLFCEFIASKINGKV
ncbi:hypothetical protein EHQ92_11030 [Leptospira biflexa]|uniref:hypothetical protein n=1 Tax=Leptospira biflexa TaxID=172 RepID=UPI0010835765|nr:hypothetical protein [Leptospira biflexa]TGM34324.1 hypothetical protein EHQ89_14140 [Leptospira biflexa]TGM40021.1 hypothetical protein EHQ80_02190 [Leptospira biflexa]TGM48385.1 hypothetical protein EHQ92_11030 [Leptospira biflexa]TGM49149.1 hypothetical protein EHQ88_02045 [Leptospira biflexa]TGM54418.1 hypothetical protein EHQ91_05395 [Leptospira biflexa]